MHRMPPQGKLPADAPWSQKLQVRTNDAVAKYGFSFVLARRVIGLGIVGALYVALAQGLDIAGWLQSAGYGEVGDTIGKLAGGVVLGTMIWPVSFIGGILYIPRIMPAAAPKDGDNGSQK